MPVQSDISIHRETERSLDETFEFTQRCNLKVSPCLSLGHSHAGMGQCFRVIVFQLQNVFGL